MSSAAAEGASAPRAGRNLPAAIAVGVGLLAAVVVGLLWVPWFFVALVTAALCLGVVEVHRALRLKGMNANVGPILVGTATSVVGAYVVSRWDLGIGSMTFVVICLAATMTACLVARLRRGPDGFLRDAAASALLIAYLPLQGVFLALLLGASNGTLRILTVMLCVVAADTGAYAVGSLLGRHKMAPSISPSKTWEGLAGALIIASLVAVAGAVLILDAPWWVGLALGAPVALAATLGDLVESLIKRDAGLKDMSNVLPGHGGVMDRLDSMLLAVPTGWLVLHLLLGA